MKHTQEKRHFYEAIREADLCTIHELQQRSSRYMALRTGTFLTMVFAFAAGYDGHPAGTVLGLLLLIFFLLLVRQHNRLRQQQQLLACHLDATSSYIDRFTGKWKDFDDNGASFHRADRPQETDLHIFGPASLYQYLSCARTQRGRQRLARSLATSPPAPAKILARQQAVAELIDHPRFCLNLMARAAMLANGHDTTSLLAEIEKEPPSGSHSIVRYRTAWILPVLTLISLLLASFDVVSWSLPGLLTGLQFLLTMLFHRHNQEVLAPLADLTHELHHYEALFRELEQADFASTTLSGLQQRLRTGGASQSLRRLARLADCVSLDHNLFFFVLGNAIYYRHNLPKTVLWLIAASLCMSVLMGFAVSFIAGRDVELESIMHFLKNISENGAATAALLCSLVVTAILWAIIYRLYCRAQITTRRNP